MNVEQLEQWFKAADEDRDGVVGGSEAVRFFQRSGLAHDVLGQIWDLSSSGAASLNKIQFSTAIRLVSLAQVNGGRLPPDQARMVMIGTGPVLAPPKLQGLNVTERPTFSSPAAAGYSPQTTGQPYAPQMTGQQYMPQMTGQYTAQMTGQPYAAQMTGMIHTYAPQMTGMSVTGYMPQATGAQPGYMPQATGAVPGGYPPASAADMQRYRAAFVQLDSDRDGFVQGGECFGFFLQSGLEKVVLRDVWNVVAGNQGKLNQEQFIKCMYLMDCAKRGMPVPPALPPGPFPPTAPAAPAAPAPAAAGMPQAQASPATAAAPTATAAPQAASPAVPTAATPSPAAPAATLVPAAPAAALPTAPGAAPAAALPLPDLMSAPAAPAPQQWTLATQFGHQGMKASMDAAYNVDVKIPTLPPKADFSAEQVAKPAFQSKMPMLDASQRALLRPEDAARLEREQREVSEREQKLYAAQNDASVAKQRAEVFNSALQEVALFKSRMDVALLQAQEQAGRLQSEADQLQKRYQQAYAGAESQHEKARSTREHIQRLLAHKTEAALKLQALEQELQMIAAMDPQQTSALEKEVTELAEQVAAAEAEKAAHEMHMESVRRQKELLQRRVADHHAAAAAAETELALCTRDVAELEAKVDSAKASGDAGQVAALLLKAAGAYRSLYNLAQASGMEVPHDAELAHLAQLNWNDAVMAGTADWMDTDEEGTKGFVIANAFPDLEAMPPSIIAAINNAAEPTQPKPVMAAAPTPAQPYAPTPVTELPPPAAPTAGATAAPAAAPAAPPPAASPKGPPASKELRFSDAEELFGSSGTTLPSVNSGPVGAAPPALAAFVQQQQKQQPVVEAEEPPPKRKQFGRAAAGWDAYFDDNAFAAPPKLSPSPPPVVAPAAAAAQAAAAAPAAKESSGFGFEEDAFGGGAFASEASTPATATANGKAAAATFDDFGFGDSAF